LLNYCGIGTDFLDFTVDRHPYKHGRYTPGMHIPIHPVSAIDEARPDYLEPSSKSPEEDYQASELDEARKFCG
jgi:hypothetical protein